MKDSGRLRIGDDWNAISIIALSQQNPLKAVAEFVENSIDAAAQNITITRGRDKGQHYLRIKDDGKGIPRDECGRPDFRYVATHICDSIKRQLKSHGVQGLQGEFGIGLLSFWTVGEELFVSSPGDDGKTYQMSMRKGDPRYQVTTRHVLFPEGGTELTIRPLLPGIKQFSGEKIQWYLASELRDRIRQSRAQIRIIDRTTRTEHKVEPRQFEGRLLHEVPRNIAPQAYVELYLNRSDSGNAVGLYRAGTRVLENICELSQFGKAPWNSGSLQGIVDAGYLNITPGTRTGVIHDEALARLALELEPVETTLIGIIEGQRRAEEERASREVLRSIQKALKEALLALPAEEYDWFNLHQSSAAAVDAPDAESQTTPVLRESSGNGAVKSEPQKQFFDFPGPLFSVRMAPMSSVVPVNGTKNFRAIPRDRSQRLVEENVAFEWRIIEGEGRIENDNSEIVTFHAPMEPGLARIRVTARQGEMSCDAEGLITVAQSLIAAPQTREMREGIPAYTFRRAPGELWRSHYDDARNLIVINSGHRDFVFASRNRAVKVRYICRLYAKELILRNFVGAPNEQLLERLIELSLYTEENLK